MAKRFSEKQRTELLAKFGHWEGSAADFCRKHRLSYQTLRSWREAATKTAKVGGSPRFVEVEVLGGASGAREEGCRPVAELDLGAGVVLRVYPLKEGRP